MNVQRVMGVVYALILIVIVFQVLSEETVTATKNPCTATTPLTVTDFVATPSGVYCPPTSPSPSPSIEPTPDPTSTPSATPRPTPTPQNNPDPPIIANQPTTETKVSECPYQNTVKSPSNVHVYRSGDQAIVKWFPTEGNLAHIYYRQNVSSTWQYSVRGVQNNGNYTISGLGSQDITFAVQQVNDCSGGPISPAVIDGPTNTWTLYT